MKTKTKKKDTKSKKTIIIIILSVIIVILSCIVGWFVWRNIMEKKTTGATWSDKYYEFLKEQNELKKAKSLIQKNANISFVQTETMKEPMMVVEDKNKENKNDLEYIGIFGIVDDSVKYMGGYSGKETGIKLYYDTEKKKYKYYLYNKDENYGDYISLDTVKYDDENYNFHKLLDEKGITDYDSQEYKDFSTEFYQKKANDPNREEIQLFNSDVKVEQKTLDGKTIGYNKIDEKLVDTGLKLKYFEYKKDMDTLNLRKEVMKGKNDYKEIDSLVNKAIQKVVNEQIELLEKVKQDIEKAKNEIKADEEKKAKEAEEALYAKGLTVGSYNLRFGTYTTSIPKGGIDGSDLYGTITLKPNCVFHIKTNFDQSSFQLKNVDEDGTYTIGKEINSFETQDAIIFRTNSGYKFSFFVTNNSYFNSQSSIYNYSGS